MKTFPSIPIAKPWYEDEEIDAITRVIRSGWVSQGPEVAEFERDFCKHLGARHACAVSSCTTALHLALLVNGVTTGDEVITVSHSFIATANAVRHCGAIPVFVDIEPNTFNIDPARVEEAFSARTKAILCVHQMGMPCDLAKLSLIAQAHGVVLIEDAACALGSEINLDGVWRKVGASGGAAACFSFHPRKVISCGDGGMITFEESSNERIYKMLRQHGMNISDHVRHNAKDVLVEAYDSVGYNYRLTDIQAALGRVQLSRLDQIVSRRRELAHRYASLLNVIPNIGVPSEPFWARSNWQSYCVRLPEGISQRNVMKLMLDQGISTRRGVMCSHREPAYRDFPKIVPLTNSERAQDECILLPLFPQLSSDEQERIVESLSRACQHN